MFNCFASTYRGLENLLATEIAHFGGKNCKILNQGVSFAANSESIMAINLNSRLANRVLFEVGFGGYRNEIDIYNIANKIEWDKYFINSNSIKVHTKASNCPLKSIDFITLKVKDAICDYFNNKYNKRPNVEKMFPDVRVYNFLDKETCTIYLDTTGEALFKREYKKSLTIAPLKENLAAGLIELTKWDKNSILFDPMCGSGTIVIEALMLGLNIAPGLLRRFAFHKLINFDKNKFLDIKKIAIDNIDFNKTITLYANDSSKDAINAFRENINNFSEKLQRITKHLNKKITFDINISCDNFFNMKPLNVTGLLLTNLPHGKRLTIQDNEDFYKKIGDTLKHNFVNWKIFLFTTDLSLLKFIRLKTNQRIIVFNGEEEARLYEYKITQGIFKK